MDSSGIARKSAGIERYRFGPDDGLYKYIKIILPKG